MFVIIRPGNHFLILSAAEWNVFEVKYVIELVIIGNSKCIFFHIILFSFYSWLLFLQLLFSRAIVFTLLNSLSINTNLYLNSSNYYSLPQNLFSFHCHDPPQDGDGSVSYSWWPTTTTHSPL